MTIHDDDAQFIPDYINTIMEYYQTDDPRYGYAALTKEERSDLDREHDYPDSYKKMTMRDKQVICTTPATSSKTDIVL